MLLTFEKSVPFAKRNGGERDGRKTFRVQEEKLGRGISRHTPFPLGIS